VAITVVEWRGGRFPGLTLWIAVDEDGHSWGAGGTLDAAVAWIVRQLEAREG
jgi:hypothetical protein